MAVILAVLLGAGPLGAAEAAAQVAASGGAAAPVAPQATFSDQVSVAWVLVPVSVKSYGGRWLKGLHRRNFELRVDHQVVRIHDFDPRGQVPWSIVFMQDLSGSMGTGGRLRASHEALQYFLDNAKSGDEFALASFAGTTTTVDVPFTEDIQPLRDAMSRWDAYGKTALNDAVALLPQISSNSRNLKRAVVLITDGADNASRISAGQARDLVERADLPVYVLGLESGDPYAVKATGEKLYRYADVLNLLASMTGGKYFSIRGPDDLKEACVTIADELRYQYVLGFQTSGRGRPRYHEISVSVGKRGARVRARAGYKGTSPAR